MLTYPKLQPSSPTKVVALLILNVFLLVILFTVSIHGCWRHVQRAMLNQETFFWEVGLFRFSGSVNCDAVNEPAFHAACMSVFKNLYGSLARVSSFVCNLNAAPLKVEPQYADEARIYQQSCSELRGIVWNSIFTFVLITLSGVCLAVSVIALLRFCYKQFAYRHRFLYWLTALSHFGAFCFLGLALVVYQCGVVPYLSSVLIYANTQELTRSPITSRHVDHLGGAFILLLILLVLFVLVTVLVFFWVPVLSPDGVLMFPKKQPKKASQRARPSKVAPEEQPIFYPSQYDVTPRTTHSFWAYMPEVFQPHTYVAEVTEPKEFAG